MRLTSCVFVSSRLLLALSRFFQWKKGIRYMEQQVRAHYNTRHLNETIFAALEKIRKDNNTLELKDISPIDQLHTGGTKSTLGLLEKSGITPGSDVLDAGCGIGGSSRLMAKAFGYIVTGIDLSDQFIQTARAVTDQFLLSDQIYFQQGSILDMPFGEESFDAVLCQHVLVNIEDKQKVFKEFNRVLRKNGRLVLHEIVKGKEDPIMYPVPWAQEESISFLEPWEKMLPAIEQAGFKQQMMTDWTQPAADWWLKAKAFAEKIKNTRPVLGPHLIFGEHADQFPKTMNYNFKWNRIKAVEAVFIKG